MSDTPNTETENVQPVNQGYSPFYGKPVCNAIEKEVFQNRVKEVFDELRRVLAKSFGAYGAPTFISNLASTTITKDGFTIMKNLVFDKKEGSPVDHVIYNLASDICARLNYRVGDGTTTAIIAATAIYDAFMDPGVSEFIIRNNFLPRDIINKMKNIQEKIIEGIKEEATPINDKEDAHQIIRNIVNISSNGNREITDMITKIYKEVGSPYINCSVAKDAVTKMSIVEGFRAKVFLTDKIYVNSDEDKAIENDVDIIIFNHKVGTEAYEHIIKPLNGICSQCGRKLMVIAPYYDRVAMETTIKRDLLKEFNARHTINLILTCVHASTGSDAKTLADLAMLLNTSVIDQNIEYDFIKRITKDEVPVYKLFDVSGRGIEGIHIAHFENEDSEEKGELSLTKDDGVTKYNTGVLEDAIRVGFIDTLSCGMASTLFNGFHYDEGLYKATLANAKEELDTLTDTYSKLGNFSYDVVRAQKRYNGLQLKIAEIEVGGDSPLTQKMLKDSVDDAVLAAESAYSHGYILGCNVTTLRVIKKLRNEFMEVEDSPDKYLTLVILSVIMNGFIKVYETVINNAWNDVGFLIPLDVIMTNDKLKVSEFIANAVKDFMGRSTTGLTVDVILTSLDTILPASLGTIVEQINRISDEEKEDFPGIGVRLNSIITMCSIEENKVFDLKSRRLSDNIINSANTDIQVLTASIDLINLLLNGNQLVLTSTENFQQN